MQLEEKDRQAGEHNNRESYCGRYGHPHLLPLRGFLSPIEQNDIGNAKTKSRRPFDAKWSKQRVSVVKLQKGERNG
jgi:hypothetical protein